MTPRGERMTGDSGEQPTQDLTIFINYRRDDKVDAGRLSDRLKHRFGTDNVFFDVEEERGLNWLKEIKTRGRAASVVLCLIGKDWLEALRFPPPRLSAYVAKQTSGIAELMGWQRQKREARILRIARRHPAPRVQLHSRPH
jgi:TIR domain